MIPWGTGRQDPVEMLGHAFRAAETSWFLELAEAHWVKAQWHLRDICKRNNVLRGDIEPNYQATERGSYEHLLLCFHHAEPNVSLWGGFQRGLRRRYCRIEGTVHV